MSNRMGSWITGGVTLALLATAGWTLSRLPTGRTVPVHFDAAGHPNGWAPAGVGLLLIPGISALLWLLQIALPNITPRGANLRRSPGAYDTIWIVTALMLGFGEADIVAAALGHPVNVTVALPVALGLMFVVIGNVLPKLRWNYVIGIRTPWTLADERVWDKTHRFGGWVMVLGGVALVIGALIPPYVGKPGLVAGTVGLIAALTIGKSYLLWREINPGGPARPVA